MNKNIKSFSQYIAEADQKEMVFTFGRFNPPTIGHQKLIEKAASVAKGNSYRIYASQSQDAKKNPLSFDDKVKFMRKMFPKHGRNIVSDKDVRTAFDVLVKLYDQGYTAVKMVVGSDRVNEFKTLLNKYNGQKGRHGFYAFENGVEVVSAGERDPDADGAEGMSASKMRNAAMANDFETFMKGLPKGYSDARRLFNAVRKGMNLEEETDIDIEPVFEERESYIKGELFNKGDEVSIIESGTRGTIISLGTNYVMVEMTNGQKKRKWLTDIQLVSEEADAEEPKTPKEKLLRRMTEETEKFDPPASARSNAKKVLNWKKKYGEEVDAMTETGWRRATQLASGKSVSYDIVKRMAAFARHRKNAKIDPKLKDTPWKDNGYVAWLGWGGDAGVEWAQKIVDKKENE